MIILDIVKNKSKLTSISVKIRVCNAFNSSFDGKITGSGGGAPFFVVAILAVGGAGGFLM